VCVTTTKAAYKNGVAVVVEVAEPREEPTNKIVKNMQKLASPTVQEFKPRILIPKNYGKYTCGIADHKIKNHSCCHGSFDDLVIPEFTVGDNINKKNYKNANACPVNIGGFESFYPSTNNQDSVSMYESQHDTGEVMIGTLSTIGAPAATLAVQRDNSQLDKHQDTHPGGAGWWSEHIFVKNKVTNNYKKLRMQFGATQSANKKPIGAKWLSAQFVSNKVYWLYFSSLDFESLTI